MPHLVSLIVPSEVFTSESPDTGLGRHVREEGIAEVAQ